MTLAIDTNFLSQQKTGHVISYANLAEPMPEETGSFYRTAHGRSLPDFNNKTQLLSDKQPRPFSKPVILGGIQNISDGPDITSGGIIVKNKDSFDIAIPAALEQFLSAADFTARNLLETYGKNGFKNAYIQLIVQRTDIHPEEAHRKPFSNWHDHLDARKTAEIDLVYSFNDTLPTIFKHNGIEKPTADSSLTRFGAEVLHKSPKNTQTERLRRTWGALIVTPHQQPIAYAENLLLGETNNDEHKEAAQSFLDRKRNSHFMRKQPQMLF